MTKIKKNAYSSADEAALIQMRSEGKTYRAIGKFLNRSATSVMQKAHRMKVPAMLHGSETEVTTEQARPASQCPDCVNLAVLNSDLPDDFKVRIVKGLVEHAAWEAELLV
jgi:hypothetical protein